MTGGFGADVFVFRSLSETPGGTPDSITDFQTGDLLDLSAIDADGNATNGDQAFSLSTVRQEGVSGQLVFAAGMLSGYIDADNVADFQIALTGRLSFGIADFIP